MRASITGRCFCVLILLIAKEASCNVESCVQKSLLSFLGKCLDSGPECIDTCGDGSPVNATTKLECDAFSDCCFRDGQCIRLSDSTTPVTREIIPDDIDNTDEFDDLLPDDMEDPVSDKRQFGPPRDAFDRLYVNRFGDSSPITCNTDRFPYNCRQESYSSNNLECVVNVPYCLRVPCLSAHSQREVDNNAISCGSYPGCCYDEELSVYRRHFGDRILPGVPVCHYAVRNHIFQKHAQQYSETFGGWNPMLTMCLIEALKEKIFGDTAGCYMATAVEFFGLKAKQAGWKGIGPLECYLIDGCFRPTRGCVYPFDASKGVRLSANDHHATESAHDDTNTAGNNLHSKYPCQEFTNLNDPYAFLTTYHQCLSSGCSVDKSIQNLYLRHLWNVSRALGPRGSEQYWKGVMAFEIRADNFLEELEKYQEFYNEPDYETPIVPLNIQSNQMPAHSFSFFPQPVQYQRTLYPSHVQQGRCAFQKPEVPNFPVLRGSFEGCCDKPLCYFSSQLIRREQLYSELTYYYSAWSAWSKCSKSCGGGHYRRVRTCVSHNQVTDKTGCPGQEELKPCNTFVCPHWGSWGGYGACSVTCGGGLRARRRLCSKETKCSGPAMQTHPCGEQKCESATVWSVWSACSVSCGTGYQTRSRRCLKDCPKNFKPFDNQKCVVHCGEIVWGPWSACEEQTCKMSRKASCVYRNTPGFCKETVPSRMTTECVQHTCYCKKYPAKCQRQAAIHSQPVINQAHAQRRLFSGAPFQG